MPKSKRFEEQTIQTWPEILGDIRIESIPSDYVRQIKVNFSDGREWLIDMTENHHADVDEILSNLYAEYDSVIESINFNIDIKKIKADIEKRTSVFLKKRK